MSKFGKYFLLATGFALLATFARIPGAIINVHAHDGGCSVASLKGTYAFRRTGVNNVVGGPIAEIGISVLNGDGTRGLIRSTRSTNGEIRPWTDDPHRTEATRSIRIVRGRSSMRTAHTAKTSLSLTEARDSSCSAWRRARLPRKRG